MDGKNLISKSQPVLSTVVMLASLPKMYESSPSTLAATRTRVETGFLVARHRASPHCPCCTLKGEGLNRRDLRERCLYHWTHRGKEATLDGPWLSRCNTHHIGPYSVLPPFTLMPLYRGGENLVSVSQGWVLVDWLMEGRWNTGFPGDGNGAVFST